MIAIWEPEFGILEPDSEILVPVFRILEPDSEIPVPVFGILEPDSEILVPVFGILEPVSEIPVPVFEIPEPVSKIPVPVFGILVPVSEIPVPVFGILKPVFGFRVPVLREFSGCSPLFGLLRRDLARWWRGGSPGWRGRGRWGGNADPASLCGAGRAVDADSLTRAFVCHVCRGKFAIHAFARCAGGRTVGGEISPERAYAIYHCEALAQTLRPAVLPRPAGEIFLLSLLAEG